MAGAAEDTEVKTSAEGAQAFIDWYYASASDRKPLRSFYVNGSPSYAAASITADISVNGLVVKDPAELERLLETQANGSRVKYDIEGFDAHVLNPNFLVACPDSQLQQQQQQQKQQNRGSARDRAERDAKVSIMAMVNGAVQFGTDKDAPRRPFTEVFVLVPNWESMGSKAPRNAKRFLVLSQNYRAM
ncbi:hypothetical protein GGTG_06247 [Gaeumannomyces tritici R3-111a-1]|uniref:NTF2 domain-containing protein n=1 Tax=Gaeumannomyces tritici (strain R3-111a-1) TaxID=644352 RepID=J3NY94_GAET3|nr:hypothetical protein GGTG_06247 [Gaeumannomyces tritici R3-111a-1]EJT76327.1 hypothetical protein GGTG_06247 [Gaeumannomyces tritici R3-111a-1]